MGTKRPLFGIVRGQQRQRVQTVFDVRRRPADERLEAVDLGLLDGIVDVADLETIRQKWEQQRSQTDSTRR